MYGLRRTTCRTLVWLAILLVPLEAWAAWSDETQRVPPTRCADMAGSEIAWQDACHASATNPVPREESAPAVIVPRTDYELINSADQSASVRVHSTTDSRLIRTEATGICSASQRCSLLCKQQR